jgi:phosphoglycolate phosphatase-like HAD superfamily hydrolase
MLETLPSATRVAIFDFDGTVSLIRSGWFQIMTGMMIETLAGLNSSESESGLRRAVEDSIWGLTGKDTIYQMMALADHVKSRGGNPLDINLYMADFQRRLAAVTGARIQDLQTGACPPDRYLVPGTRTFLEALRARGLHLYLASGTLETCVKQECDLLDITRYFDGGIYGALEDYKSFSKRILVERILAEPGMKGAHLVGFGDGPVEIEEVRRGGGMAVGVAPLEPECLAIDPWKRERLRAAGAQSIIPNYLSPAPRYEIFDRSRLLIKPIAERSHDLHLDRWLPLDAATPPFDHPDLAAVGARLRQARTNHSARILMMGGHVLRAGVNRHLIDLIERGFIDHVAMNGAGAIHDYELARIGATTESVDRYIRTGEFGLWRETGELNDWIREAANLSLGLGENLGRRIEASDFPHRDLSVFAAAYRAGVPITVHPGIGYDIIHQHPNCDGAALGASAYHDFLIFVRTVERLEGGVLLNFGSAVMGPEVYLKALAMARNVARQEGREIRHFTTAVFDVVPIHGDPRRELPKTDPGYYFRPHKTILVRTVADGGESFYFAGDHRATLPALRRVLMESA